MLIIGTDGWLLPRAIEVESFRLDPGQRHDMIIGFQGAPDEVFLENITIQDDGRIARGVNPDAPTPLLKFEVGGANEPATSFGDGAVIWGNRDWGLKGRGSGRQGFRQIPQRSAAHA